MISSKRPGYFSPNQVGTGTKEFYDDNGFIVMTDAVNPDEIHELRDETVAICRGLRGRYKLPASTRRFPVYPDVKDFEGLSDDEVIKQFLCIHHTHKISDIMLGYLAHQAIVDVLTNIIGPNIKCMQSMLFIKAVGKPGQAWHQDEDFIPTRDRSLCGAWIAMDDATQENGCLWVIPGSSKQGVLWPMYPHDDPRFDCTSESFGFPYTDDDAIAVEVPAGSIVFFNGYLLHRSFPNNAEKGFRRVLVNHYMSAESLLPWFPQEGIGMAKTDFRDIVMIAGHDPYTWKPTEHFFQPHVRKEGNGGCAGDRYDFETFKKEGMTDRSLF